MMFRIVLWDVLPCKMIVDNSELVTLVHQLNNLLHIDTDCTVPRS
jgi:hypothetical protein